MRYPKSSRSGFTLIETLVAFAILALSLIALFGGMAQSVRMTGRASFYAGAVNLIESRFARIGISEPAAPGMRTGQLPDGSLWTLQIQTYDKRSNAVWIEMTVRQNSDETSPAVSMATLKLLPRLEVSP